MQISNTMFGKPPLPVVTKRRDWRTLLMFNLDAWAEESPLIAVASDILRTDNLQEISYVLELDFFHHAEIVGTAVYRSPPFGWLSEEKEAVLIRLGTKDKLRRKKMKELADYFALPEKDYRSDSAAFIVEKGEKEYSFEVAGIREKNVEVLLRYTDGGSDSVREIFAPDLLSVDFYCIAANDTAEIFKQCFRLGT